MELIKIYNGKLVDARELHTFLGSKQDFSDWIKNRIKKYGFEDGKDYSIKLWNNTGLRGKPKKEYALTLNMAKELAMVENNQKGKQARRYFIEAEEALQELGQNKRLEAFLKLEATKGRLQQNIFDIGGTKTNYIQIDTAGRRVLFNGQLIPDEELGLLALKGRDFATEITNKQLKEDIYTLDEAELLNKDNHYSIRETLLDKNIKPEDLPREEKIKKLGK